MERRTIVAFLVAPLVIPFVFLLPFPGTTVDRSGTFVEHLRGIVAWLAVLFLYTSPIAYVAELVLGVAVWKAFKRLGIRSPFAFATAGAVMGWLVFVVILRGKNLTDLSNPYFFICIAAGVASTVLFRFVAFSGSKAENSK
jgi:NhaP-type Na+/H+ or K+/H+ antiporter